MRSHSRSLFETVLGTACLAFGFWYLHIRATTETLGWHDFAIFAGCAVLGLLLGYRDRIPLLVSGTRTIVKARFSGKQIPPTE